MKEITKRTAGRLPLALGAGLAGMLVPVAATFAVTILTRQHVDFIGLLWNDKARWLPLALGFGMQVGMYILLKKGTRLPRRTPTAGAATTTGGSLSTLAMMACCAPGALTALLPLLGVSAAASVLAAWNMPLMIGAAAVNAVGIAVMLYTLVKRRRVLRAVQPGRLQAMTPETR